MSIYDDLDASVLEESIYTDLNPNALDDLSIAGSNTNIYDDLDVNIEVGYTTSDLKDRIDNTPWYESMAYELEKLRHNAKFGMIEGVGELYRSGMQLLGKDVKNPMNEGIFAQARTMYGLSKGITPQEYEDSIVRDVARIGTQVLPVGAAVSAVSKLPKVAQVVSKVPKALRLPAGAGITEFIALASDEKGLADAIAEAGFENPLQKKDTDTILTGKFKSLAEGSVGGAFAKLGVKIADKAIVPAVNKTFSAIDKTLGTVDKYIRPIKTKLKEIDPFVASRLDRFELDVLMAKQDFTEQIKPFANQFKKLKKNEQNLFQRLM